MNNATTVLSVASGMVFAYALGYLVLLIEVAVFMPGPILESRLHTSVGPLNYFASARVSEHRGTDQPSGP